MSCCNCSRISIRKDRPVSYTHLGEAVEIHGSGRTDAGVHAAGQVANFWSGKVLEPGEMVRYLNTYLPQDIAVLSAENVPERFHSRLLAASKE